jgi:hypothetical protein
MGVSQGVEPEKDETMPLKPEGADEGEPDGLVGPEECFAQLWCRGGEFSQRYDPWEHLGHLWPTLRFEGRVAA